MTDATATVGQLLAAYWLQDDPKTLDERKGIECLRQFADGKRLLVSDAVLQQAVHHLNGGLAKGDVGQWIVLICFWGHPHAIWDFMLDALSVAESDEHLGKIATGLAEHILAHYGSMMPYFEEYARADSRFKRMLTGVWRHRMSDDVWMRLRAMQAEVSDPLSTMIPLEHGVEYMAHSLSREDRVNEDKSRCRYRRDAEGNWRKAR